MRPLTVPALSRMLHLVRHSRQRLAEPAFRVLFALHALGAVL